MKRSCLRCMAVAVISGCLLFPCILLAERHRVPGTHLTIEPPAGFSPAEQFPGFYRAEFGASVMVTELPGPAAEVQNGMTKDGLAARGMVLLESQPVQVDGREGSLLHIRQEAAGLDYLKWFLVAGDERGTTLVVGTFPASEAALLSAPVRQAVLSSAWDRQAKVDLFEGLLFRLEPTPKLKIANRMNNMVIFNEEGSLSPLGPGEPFYIAGNAVAKTDIPDLEAFSRTRALQSANISLLRNARGRPIRIDGLDAYELLAEATHRGSGIPIQFYQVIAPADGTYFILQGFVEAGRAVEFLAEFRHITDSFRKVKP
jgi:hypothetical protein